MGKGVPADHWEQIAGKGFQLVYGSTANLFTDRHGNYIGYGPEAWELVGLPDVETFCQLPWDPRTARRSEERRVGKECRSRWPAGPAGKTLVQGSSGCDGAVGRT